MTEEITGHWKKHCAKDSNHLHCCDIYSKTPLNVTIEGVVADTVLNDQNKEEPKTFLRFKGAEKILAINVTNGAIIAAVTGEKLIEEWIGKKITLRTAVCRGEECIRVHAPKGTKLPKKCPRFDYTDEVKA